MGRTAMDAHAINFAWLIRLRWGALAGQIITIVAVDRVMHISLPWAPLVFLLAVELASNLACAIWAARRPRVREAHLAATMALDVVILTGLLYFTGGPFNPFSFLYLVHLALGAVVLPAAWTWALFGLSLACFGSLFSRHIWLALDLSTIDLHMHHMQMHLEGMWVAVGVAGAFIIYFVSRISRALAARDAELAAARAAAERQARLASLATLATGAAHELATPLSTIATAAKELERRLAGRDDAPARDDARLIREQVDRCRAILDQLAVDAGYSGGDGAADVSIEGLVRGSLDGLDGARVRVGGDPLALARTLRVPVRPATQAIRGVLKNALDATDGGAVEVSCGVEAAAVRVEIRDDGPGMAPDVLARAGEPFFTTKEPGRGMGLGLFLTRTVLEHLGGSLRLDSTPGGGTRAELRFPLAAAGAP